MRKLILAVFLACSMLQAKAQVWDITTGVDVMMNPLPLNTPDDDWTMCPPSGNPWVPGSYGPVRCGTGAPVGYAPYFGHWNTVRWLSPDVLPSGEHDDNSPVGDYYYKYTFHTGPCEIQSAVINFNHIGADNYIDQVIMNGNVYPVYYTFNPFTNGVSITLAAGDVLPNFNNELLIRVHNLSTYTGMEIAGNITVTTSGAPDPSFGSSYVGNQLNIGSAVAGNHTWEIYGSATGNQGTYNYIGTFYSPTLAIASGYSCLFVKHTVSNDCGTACKAISICNLDCSWQPCGVSEPTGLTYDASSGKLSWNPVPGADHYVIEIILNDPACCGGSTTPYDGPIFANNYRTITVYGNTYTLSSLDLGETFIHCFSWRVLAVCANGYSVASPFKCENFRHDYGPRSEIIENDDHQQVEAFKVKVFPNPSRDIVSIALENDKPVDYEVKIYDMNGKLLQTFLNLSGEEKNLTIRWNAESVSKGTYLVVVTTSDNKVEQRKVVIE